MKQGEWIGGVWIPNKKQNNNPNGYNKHKKNPTPNVEIVKEIAKEDVQEAYIDMWKAKNEFLSKCHIYKELHDRFFGFDEIKKTMV